MGLIETSPPKLVVNEGVAVEFHCRAENFPNVKNVHLKWRYESLDKKRSYAIPNDRWFLNTESLADQTNFIELLSTRVEDSGLYICTEPNGAFATSELIVMPDKGL